MISLNHVSGVSVPADIATWALSAADLASLFAIVSSFKNKALAKGIAVFGEVGLAFVLLGFVRV